MITFPTPAPRRCLEGPENEECKVKSGSCSGPNKGKNKAKKERKKEEKGKNSNLNGNGI